MPRSASARTIAFTAAAVLAAAAAIARAEEPPVPTPPLPSPEAVRLNESGLLAMERGAYAAALESFEGALALEPDVEAAAANTAEAAAHEARRVLAADPARALALADRAVQLRPERVWFRVLRAQAALAGARPGGAVLAARDLAHALARDPDHYDALVGAAGLAYEERRLAEAVAFLERAVRLAPADERARTALDRARRELAVEEGFAEVVREPFVVRHGESVPRGAVQTALDAAQEAYRGIGARLGHYPESRVVVTLYMGKELRDATGVHAWAAGVSDGTIRLRVPADSGALRRVVLHEYTHHVVRELAPATPLWLHEGLAQLMEGADPAAAERRLAARGEPRAVELSVDVSREPDPERARRYYDLALGFTAHLDDLAAGEGFYALLRALGRGMGEDAALREVYGATRDELFERWRRLRTGR